MNEELTNYQKFVIAKPKANPKKKIYIPVNERKQDRYDVYDMLIDNDYYATIKVIAGSKIKVVETRASNILAHFDLLKKERITYKLICTV